MENGEVDSYNNVLFYTANDEQMDQRTLSALSHLSRGYDMVQVYNKMSDYNDKSYGLLISQVGQYTKHLGEVYQYAYNRECGWRYQGRLEKDGLGFGSITSFKETCLVLSIPCTLY
jgi:hypothetical protein